jgi:hypothetical protein
LFLWYSVEIFASIRRTGVSKRALLVIIGALVLAACSGVTGPSRTFVKGDELAYYDFSQNGTFEEGTYGDGAARLTIQDGAYNIKIASGDSTLWYGQWGKPVDNVIIDVDARQLTESTNTVYGVICRARGQVGITAADVDPQLAALAAENSNVPLLQPGTPEATAPETAEATLESTTEAAAEGTAESTLEATADVTEAATVEPTAAPTATPAPMQAATSEATAEASAPSALNLNNGDGYLFLVGGSGRFAIMRSRGRSVTPLVNWTSTDKVNKGAASNRIRAVCFNNYLALYVNDSFLGEATDDTYTRGQVGLVAAGGSRLGEEVNFDNLTVSSATSS